MKKISQTRTWHIKTLEANVILKRNGKTHSKQLIEFTRQANNYRDIVGMKNPITQATVWRYSHSGKGYENGGPKWFREFTDLVWKAGGKRIVSK